MPFRPQGLLGFDGPVGHMGIPGEKVSMISICHTLLFSVCFNSLELLSVDVT